jgi:hypothetical protein
MRFQRLKARTSTNKHGAITVQTDLFKKNGRNFNKGAAINEGEDAQRPIKLDGEQVPQGISRLIAVDYDHDLSLIEIIGGNAPNVAPVAGPGHKPSSHLLSVGYDEMRLPATRLTAHIIKSDNDITWTREPPWHGRSGGALLDLDSGTLIGVVSATSATLPGPGSTSATATSASSWSGTPGRLPPGP